MPSYRKRPRAVLPPPLAGGGEQSNAEQSIVRGRGTLRSRQLRFQSPDAERKLWDSLRRKQINGLRFRRQFPLGPYFADFVCLPARLVVEVDGSQHAPSLQTEVERAKFLESQGYRVLRFWNNEVLTNLDGVHSAILQNLRDHPLPALRADLPHQGGGV